MQQLVLFICSTADVYQLMHLPESRRVSCIFLDLVFWQHKCFVIAEKLFPFFFLPSMTMQSHLCSRSGEGMALPHTLFCVLTRCTS